MKSQQQPAAKSAGLFDRVQQFLDEQQVQHALELLNHCGQETPAVRNARGVCLLRLGRPEEAMRFFRELVFAGGVVNLMPGVPTVFVTNYVTALLLMDQIITANSVLYSIPEKDHPAVRQLAEALASWRRSLPIGRRLLLCVGVCPSGTFRLAFPPGRLVDPGKEA